MSLLLKSAALVLSALVAGGFLFAALHVNAEAPAYDLLITNARIVDGSGNPWFRADVAIKDGRIARIGRIGPETATRTIDAHGQILAPGFIDVHTHVESIYELPSAENFVRMGVTLIYHGMGEDDLKRIMQEPFTMIASDSGVRQVDESVPHPRGYGNNALPAQTFGFRDRGLIREGFAADLVIFDENTIIDQATFDKPHQFPLGISYVIVNGAPVLENNQMTEARPGISLRGLGYNGEFTVGVALRGHP